MTLPGHLLWVNSKPTKLSPEDWIKWYNEEHLESFVNTKAVTNGAFYQEVSLDPNAKPHEMPFLALYQTTFPDAMRTKEFTTTKQPDSKVFQEHGLTQSPIENGAFDARNYENIQEYDPNNNGNVTTPFICTVEMNTTSPSEFDDWYRNEHLPLLSKMPTWKRTLRYKAGPKTDLVASEQATFLAIYFVEDMAKAFLSPEAAAANATELTKKFIGESNPPAIGRTWRLIGKHQIS